MTEAFYSEDFYEGMQDANLASARIVVPFALQFVQPKSVIDIGCGQGLWLRAFIENGISDVEGYDGEYVDREKLHIPKERFHGVNLEKPIQNIRAFDLAVSLEVAEHLSHEASRTMVVNLTNAAPVILFSAAIPGQGGVHHVNEQWADYWQERFKEKGYVPVDCIRRHVWDDNRVSFFYAQNILMYVKEELLTQYPKLQEEIRLGHGKALSLVHPKMYEYYESRWNKIAPLIWKVPLPLIKWGSRLLGRKK